MISTGMVFRLNSEDGSGFVMLTGGVTKEFTQQEWVDTQNEPKVGLKISYEVKEEGIEVKVLEEAAPSAQKTVAQEIQDFSSTQEHIEYFENAGFKLVKRPINTSSKDATLRRYSMDQHEEIVIKEGDSKIRVTKTINGQKSPL